MLEELYAPLMARLAAASGTLKKLSFSVARVANVEQWASEAEDGLIDLRKAGAFRGKGTLLQKTNEVLKGVWETGDSTAVVVAMTKFRRLYQKDLLDHSPVTHTDQAEFRAWSKRSKPRFASARAKSTLSMLKQRLSILSPPAGIARTATSTFVRRRPGFSVSIIHLAPVRSAADLAERSRSI